MDKFVEINRQHGKFTINKPSKKSTRIAVIIPEFDFNHTFAYSGNRFGGIERMEWQEAIDEIAHSDPMYAGDKEPKEDLQEIINEHWDRIATEYMKHRLQVIENKIEDLESEKEKVERKL